jgi:hypothetical protein
LEFRKRFMGAWNTCVAKIGRAIFPHAHRNVPPLGGAKPRTESETPAPSNAELLQLAQRHQAPADWYDEDE